MKVNIEAKENTVIISPAEKIDFVTAPDFEKIIEDNGGEIVYEEDWGLKKLAYPIQKKSTGFYELFEFTAEPEVVDLLETQFRRDERIIRFLTVKMDKYAQAYAEKRRNKAFVHADKPAEKPAKAAKKELDIPELEDNNAE